MRFVPAHAAAVHAAGDPGVLAAYRTALVTYGSRPAVDLGRLPDGLGRELGAWWDACEQLWEAARSGPDHLAGHSWVMTRRALVADRQSTTKGAKRDLGALFDALSLVPGVGELVDEVCAPTPAVSKVRALVAALGGRVNIDEPGRLNVTVSPQVGVLLPALAGGPVWAGEVSREFTIEARHASWRDRKVRRLAAVDVTSVHMWADPTA